MLAVQTDHPPGGVAMITGELTRYGSSMLCVTKLQTPPGSGLAWPMGVLVAHNINLAFQSIIDNPALQWVWLMGDDHTFPPDILLKLLDRNVDVVVPLCLNRGVPIEPTIAVPYEGTHAFKTLDQLPLEGGLMKLGEGEVCGDAGILIRRHVLEAIGSPWYDRKKSGAHDAEDREFIARVKEAGFDVYIDLDNPIGHIAPMEIMPVRRDHGWVFRLSVGGRPVVELGRAK